jgi:hypothetical protein
MAITMCTDLRLYPHLNPPLTLRGGREGLLSQRQSEGRFDPRGPTQNQEEPYFFTHVLSYQAFQLKKNRERQECAEREWKGPHILNT